MIQAEYCLVLQILQCIERFQDVGLGLMILIDVSITQLDAGNETVWYQLSHVDSCIHVVAHVVELSDIHYMIFAVVLLSHGSLNPVNHVGAVCVESAYGCGKTGLSILGSYLEGGVLLRV